VWTPIKLKKDPSARGWETNTGWYCYDTVSLAADPRKHYSGKQAAQKECDRRNEAASAAETDGKTRNPKRWYTIGYVDCMATLVPGLFQDNPVHHHGYLSELLRQTVETLQGGHVPGAVVAVIWTGKLSLQSALHGPHSIPIRHVFADGRITGSTG
jgi:hypothetical protein